MNKLFFLTVVGLSCLLVAECNHEFYEHWKDFMQKSYCEEGDKEKYLACCEKFPHELKDVLKEVTGKTGIAEVMDALCADEDNAVEKVCKAMQEKESELGMTEDKMKELKECSKD